MNISNAVSLYLQQHSLGKNKVRLVKSIQVDGKTIPKGTVSHVFFDKQNGKFHFENNTLDIAFEVSSDEFEYIKHFS